MSSPFLWHTQDIHSVAHELNTDLEHGLSNKEALSRLGTYGLNRLPHRSRIPWINILLRQQISLMIPVMLIAVIILFLNQMLSAALLIIAFMIVSVIFSSLQEINSERLLQNLREIADDSTYAKVVRNNNLTLVKISDLVPGDIIYFEAGDEIPADGRLTEVQNLTIDESIFGEAIEPFEKNTDPLDEDMSLYPIHLRTNMVFMGTMVARGNGMAIVTATGEQTQIAQMLAQSINSQKEKQWLLESNLSKNGLLFAIVGIIGFALLWVILARLGMSLSASAIVSMGFLMALYPIGLIEAVRTALAFGVKKLSDHQIIVRDIVGAELLANVTVVCSNKTGIMTQNLVAVRRLFVDGGIMNVEGDGYDPSSGGFPEDADEDNPDLSLLLSIAAICNNTEVKDTSEGWNIVGDPVEGALIVAAMKGGVNKDELLLTLNKLCEFPFDPERKRMSVVCKATNGEVFIFTKGSLESVMAICPDVQLHGHVEPLNIGRYNALRAIDQSFAKSSMSNIAFAYRQLDIEPEHYNVEELERDLIFVGLIGILDSPRTDVKTSIERCVSGSIKPVIFTDDQIDTTLAFSKPLGMAREEEDIISGEDMDLKDERDDQKLIREISVFADILPEHKVRIVRAFNENKEITAMIGNQGGDADAIREANVGIAANPTNPSVTISASDLVLGDSSFATAVNAIQWMRGAYNNAKGIVRYSLSASLSMAITIIIIMLVSIFWKSPLPLSSSSLYSILAYVLWINIFAIALPAFAMSLNPTTDELMRIKPFPVGSVLNRELILKIFLRGLITAVLTFIIYAFSMVISNNQLYSVTAVVTVLLLSQLAFSFRCRRMPEENLIRSFIANKILLALVLLGILLHLLILYISPLNSLFNMEPISYLHWIPILIVSVVCFLPLDDLLSSRLYKYISGKEKSSEPEGIISKSEEWDEETPEANDEWEDEDETED